MLPIPKQLKDKYKIVWNNEKLNNNGCSTGAYIDQSQSLNLWLEDPDVKSLTNTFFIPGIWIKNRYLLFTPGNQNISPNNLQ